MQVPVNGKHLKVALGLALVRNSAELSKAQAAVDEAREKQRAWKKLPLWKKFLTQEPVVKFSQSWLRNHWKGIVDECRCLMDAVYDEQREFVISSDEITRLGINLRD